ncbi:MAG: HIRAN domain-containing protein [Bacteroidales bacterium]|nr:HIRAN domain-containing protein [Bacteroidales bacterium]
MTNAVFVAWRSGGNANGVWGPVGRLERIDSGYRFVYTKGARELKGFQPFPGLSDLGAVYESDELFPLFANRLLARSRPEYQQYLEWNGFDPNNPPEPIALLRVTEGQRATDQLEILPCPLPDEERRYLTKFFVHGIRWTSPSAIEQIHKLKPGDHLGLLPDINNEVDPNAVAVRNLGGTEKHLLGYVPRYLAYDVRKLCLSCTPGAAVLTVERVNPDAPLQFRLLCRLRACWPADFTPCSDGLYQPIPDAVGCDWEQQP